MRYFLSLFALAMSLVCTEAATPSFSSFATNQFTTNGFVIRTRLNSTQFDGSGSSITITNINGVTGGTNYFGTVYMTNLYLTNLFITNVVDITTNVTIYTNVYVTNAYLFVNGTNVGTINPTDGYVPYRLNSTNFADSSIRWIDATTVGTPTLVVDDLAAGGIVVSEATSGIVTNLVQGTGALTNDGAGNLGWAVMTNIIINPTDGYLPARGNATTFTNSWLYNTANGVATDTNIFFGPGTTNVLYRSGTDLLYDVSGGINHSFGVTNSAGGGMSFMTISSDGNQGSFQGGAITATFGVYDGSVSLVMANNHKMYPSDSNATDLGSRAQFWKDWYQKGNTYITGFDDQTDYSRLAISHTGTNGAVVFDSQSSGIAGSPRDYAFLFGGTNKVQFSRFGGVMLGGASTSNNIPPNTATLISSYRNSAAGDPSQSQVNFIEADSGSSSSSQWFLTQTTSGADVYLNSGSATGSSAIIMSVNGGTDASLSIETNGAPNLKLYQNGKSSVIESDVRGFGTPGAATDYALLSLTHTGTNGYAKIASSASGIAGSARPVVFAIGTTTNAFRIDPTNWVDSFVPQTSVRNGATAPTTIAFASGPASVTAFQDNRDDEVEFSVQLNHNYKQGTDVSPHVHWTQTTAASAQAVVWELCSTWANVNAVYNTWSTNYVTNTISGTAWTHQLSDFPELTGTSKTVSSILVCRLRRLANSATADNYTANAAFLGFDIHYQVDSPGSDGELTKSF